jgi:hypothetical protein
MVSKRCASVYRRKGKLLIASSSQTSGRYGLWIEAGPHLVAEVSESQREIGEKVLEALKASRQGEPYPSDPEQLAAPLLKRAGVHSWSTFIKGVVQCHVEEEGKEMRFIPSTKDGGGFVPRAHEAVTVALPTDPERLGEALLEALSRSGG